MAMETWLVKFKQAISNTNANMNIKSKKKKLGVIAFQVSGLITKLTNLQHSLSLPIHSLSSHGVRKLVSNDSFYLISLACAESIHTVRSLAISASHFAQQCQDPNLRTFRQAFEDFADSGRDLHGWTKKKAVEKSRKKLNRYLQDTMALYREMEELTSTESALRRSVDTQPPECKDFQRILHLEQKICNHKRQIRCFKRKSLWGTSFDSIVPLLASWIFTALATIKLVYGVGSNRRIGLNRSLSASAAVYPSGYERLEDSKSSFFDTNSKVLRPGSDTLGFGGLALHYANLIIMIEKMIKWPQQIGIDSREDLYSRLPYSLRSKLRSRLRGVWFYAGDAKLASEWNNALERILGWISPLAHNMIRWQNDRSFEQKKESVLSGTTGAVLLLQTLFFADTEKTESAITELLVGLNYVWRFDREMTVKALFDSSNFNPNSYRT